MSVSPAPQHRRAPRRGRAKLRLPRADRFLQLPHCLLAASQVLRAWLQDNTFAPLWLPKPWRHPLVGASVSVLLAGGTTGLTLLLLHTLPVFVLPGMLPMLGIVVVALTWGAASSLLATLTSTALLEGLVLPHYFSVVQREGLALMHAALFVLLSLGIALLTSQSAWARRRAEALASSLKEAQTSSDRERFQLRALVESFPVPFALIDTEERILEYNPAVQALWGKAAPLPQPLPRELADFQQVKAWWPATGQSVSPRTWAIARAMLTGERVTNEEVELELADGQRKSMLESATPIRDAQGAIQGAVGVLQDITERKRLEEAMRHAQQDAEAHSLELEAIFEALTDALVVYDADGRILRSNTTARQLFGFEAQPDFLALPLEVRAARYALRDVADQPILAEHFAVARLLRGEILTSAQATDQHLQMPDGRAVWVNVTGRPLCDAEGAITGAVAIARDVTERRRLEREVAERAAQLETIFESIADGLVVTDAQGRMLQMNQALRTMLGIELDPTGRTRLQLEALAGYAAYTTAGHLLREGEDPISTALEGQVLSKAHSVDLLFRTRDGREVWANGTSAPIRGQQGQIIGCVGVIRDVTKQRHLEQHTREALDALLAMAEALVQVPEAAQTSDPSSGSRSAERTDPTLAVTARRLAELTRRVLGCQQVSIAAVEPETRALTPITVVGVTPEQEQHWWASWDESSHLGQYLPPSSVAALRAGETIVLKHADLPLHVRQARFPAPTSWLVPMRMGETLVGGLRVDEAVEQGERCPEEVALTRAVARLGALVLERERLLRERTEARANELALRETQAQMETFLGIAGHELKNPLTSVKLALQLIERRLCRLAQDEVDGVHDLTPFLDQVVRAAHQACRLERLVNELLDVARVRAGKLDLHLDAADLAAIVHEAVEEQRQAHPERTLLTPFPSERPVPVVADADRLVQVVTNYLTNALKYSSADRPVAVGLDVEKQQARVWVRDQGPGLPPEEQERIWDRFHRVTGIQAQSGTGVGLGLGLHICRTIIERHHGQVGVESAPGQGSTFWCTLPLSGQG